MMDDNQDLNLVTCVKWTYQYILNNTAPSTDHCILYIANIHQIETECIDWIIRVFLQHISALYNCS